HTVRVSSSTMDHGTPLLFDGLGRSVQGNWPDLVNGSLYIDVRDLPNGIYTIRILGEATQATGRFVKE
ncbi:MAG: T9SS type A sorting domain-containing protein, partial [Flavobacteriales bacterium]|nr:T9SS type A sorting domain-containing protein [Flavobacteriales bacterium]